MSPDLELALRLADAADAIALGRFRSRDLVVETKPDRTPVTDADREIEHELRAMLGAERRRDAILGEEQGATGSGRRRWIVDPIDGTRNYSRGIPVWATLIALEEDGQVMLGVVSAPALHRRWWAERGGGAHAGGDGDFWSHMLVAEGAIDGAIDAIGVSVWDLAAVQVIVEEAGGTFTDFAGEHRIDGGSAISSNGHLHPALLEAVRELPRSAA